MRQGSLLSPTLFNLFINDLLIQLKSANTGIRIEDLLLNSCAYADDATIFSSTIPGLQQLMDISSSYANRWRFKFSSKKTKCIIFGKQITTASPSWSLYGLPVATVEEVDVLGITFSSDNKHTAHIEKRISSCRKSIFGLSSVGMSYPGLSSDIKAHIWNSVGASTLLYGMDSIALDAKELKRLSVTATTLVKSVLGLPKRSHHSSVLSALNIPTVQNEVQYATVNLYQRIFREESPVRQLQARLLAKYVLTGKCVCGTILSNIIKYGLNPVTVIYNTSFKNCKIMSSTADGMIDTLRYLLCHENFVKPWSEEYRLARLLTSAF